MARRGRIDRPLADAALAALESGPIRSIAGRPHARTARRIAFELSQSAYDSLYLAVALAERTVFVTADLAFARAARGHPAYAGSVKTLGETAG